MLPVPLEFVINILELPAEELKQSVVFQSLTPNPSPMIPFCENKKVTLIKKSNSKYFFMFLNLINIPVKLIIECHCLRTFINPQAFVLA